MNELAVLDTIQNIHVPWLDTMLAAYTTAGDHGYIWIMLGICLLFFRKTRWAGIAMLIALAVGALMTSGIIKPLVMRPRPCDVNAAVHMIIPRPGGSSFPSGHTTAAFAAFGALLFAKDPRPPAALTISVGIAAVIMGFSRLYAYVHYPSDVLIGMVVGMFAGFVAARTVQTIREKWKEGEVAEQKNDRSTK